MPNHTRTGIGGMYLKTHTITTKNHAFKILAFFFFASATLSQTSLAEESQAALPDAAINNAAAEVSVIERSQSEAQMLLAESVEPEELVWLETRYPEAADTIKVLALKKEAKQAPQQGAVLIIPDKQQHANWPTLVKPLRSELSFSGRFTLSISLPWPNLSEIPKRELPTKNTDTYIAKPRAQKETLTEVRKNNGNNEELDINLAGEKTKNPRRNTRYATRALAHVQAAADYINAQGFQNITIIAIGESADLALSYIQEKADAIEDQGFALIMIGPKLSAPYQHSLETAFGKDFQAPILDIVASDDLSAQSEARERKANARMARIKNYSQVKLAAPTSRSMHLSVNKRIKTWLAKYAAGEELRN